MKNFIKGKSTSLYSFRISCAVVVSPKEIIATAIAIGAFVAVYIPVKATIKRRVKLKQAKEAAFIEYDEIQDPILTEGCPEDE